MRLINNGAKVHGQAGRLQSEPSAVTLAAPACYLTGCCRIRQKVHCLGLLCILCRERQASQCAFLRDPTHHPSKEPGWTPFTHPNFWTACFVKRPFASVPFLLWVLEGEEDWRKSEHFPGRGGGVGSNFQLYSIGHGHGGISRKCSVAMVSP